MRYSATKALCQKDVETSQISGKLNFLPRNADVVLNSEGLGNGVSPAIGKTALNLSDVDGNCFDSVSLLPSTFEAPFLSQALNHFRSSRQH